MALKTLRSGETQAPEEIINFIDHRLVSQSGIWGYPTTGFQVQQQASPNLSVLIKQGYAYVVKSDNSMAYPVNLDADATVSITANSSGNTRKDAIVLYINLGAAADTTASNVATLAAVAGTPSGSPVVPNSTAIQSAIGASNPYIILGYITVASGASSVVTANITDARTLLTMSIPQPLAFGEYDNGNSGATPTIDWSKGDRQKITVTANTTLTFSNARAGQTLILWIAEDATGGWSITLPTIKWSPSAPTFTTTLNAVNAIIIRYDGSNYYGQASTGFS